LPPAYDDEIDLWELWDTVWSGRWLIIAITALFAVGGVTYALLAQQWWRADVVLAPADKKAIPGALGQLGGLASLAGVSIGGGGDQEPLAVLQSRGFAREFITEQNLMPVLFKDLKSDGPPPDIRDAVRIFEGIRSVSDDKKTGLVTLGIRWKDPETAANWANLMVQRLNARLRAQALAESQRNVDFLQRARCRSSCSPAATSSSRTRSSTRRLPLSSATRRSARSSPSWPRWPAASSACSRCSCARPSASAAAPPQTPFDHPPGVSV
jgi:uncharacterized protein involved in exopolysaccharide biosynthesis